MKWLIVILILATVLIAGCTQISSIACKPDWVLAGSVWDVSGWPIRNAEMCKSVCYQQFSGTTIYKIENDSTRNTENCYCDVNKCS